MPKFNEYTTLTLYSDPNCPLSHRSRIVIHEKDIEANIVDINDDELPEDVIAVNPYGNGPTLIDREVALFNANIINNYLEERFLQPALMPTDPVSRAKIRLMLYRIDTDWYSQWDTLSGKKKGKVSSSRKSLQEDLTVLAPLFAEKPFFMNDEFSLLDCSLAPLLWRLPTLNIKLPAQANAINDYCDRVFARQSFQASLCDIEQDMRP